MKSHVMFPLLIILAVVLVHANSGCKDDLQFDKAESTLKLALGLMKMVRGNNVGTENTANFNEWHSRMSEGLTETSSNVIAVRKSTVEQVNDGCKQTVNLPPTNCADILTTGNTSSEVYEIFPRWQIATNSVKVFCDMRTDGGGWTVLQRRNDYLQEAKQSFNQTFATYAKGFGDLNKEFWLGNDIIHNLTNQERMVLRIDLEDWDGQKRHVHFKDFIVAGAELQYKMAFSAAYDNTAGGALYNNLVFITPDKDTTKHKLALKLGAGFWYPDGPKPEVNLNGMHYSKGQHINKPDGIIWKAFRTETYSLKKVEMKVRPAFYFPPPLE